MGRIAASIGAAFGGGISTGISEKRRQNAQDKRDRDLAAAALVRIKEQRTFEETKLTEKRMFDAGLQLKKDIAEDLSIRTLAAGMGIKLEEGGLITKELFSPTLTFKAKELAIDQKNKEALIKVQEEKDVRQTNVKLIEFFRGAKEKDSPGGATVTSGEKAQAAREIGGTGKQLKEALSFIEGKEEKPPQLTPSQKDTLTQIRKQKTKVEKVIAGREKELRKLSEDVIAKTGRKRTKPSGILGFFQEGELAQTDAEFLSSSLKSDSTLISLREQLEELSTQEEEITSTIKPGVLDNVPTGSVDLKNLSIEELLNLGRTE